MGGNTEERIKTLDAEIERLRNLAKGQYLAGQKARILAQIAVKQAQKQKIQGEKSELEEELKTLEKNKEIYNENLAIYNTLQGNATDKLLEVGKKIDEVDKARK